MLLTGKAPCFSGRLHISPVLLLRPAVKGLRANGPAVDWRDGVAVVLAMATTILAYARLWQPGVFSVSTASAVTVPMECWMALWRSLVANAVLVSRRNSPRLTLLKKNWTVAKSTYTKFPVVNLNAPKLRLSPAITQKYHNTVDTVH